MTRGREVADALCASGYDFWSGVPCSYLRDLFEAFSASTQNYFPALREDSACAMAAGAYLGGRLPAVAMQNSGFAAASNAIASLLIPCRVPALLIVSWRGKNADSPEHDVMGAAFPGLVSALGLHKLEMNAADASRSVRAASDLARLSEAPVVVSVEKGIL